MNINIKYTEKREGGRLWSYNEIVNGDAPDGAYAWADDTGSHIYLRCGWSVVVVTGADRWAVLDPSPSGRVSQDFRYLGPVEIEITVKGVDPNE